MIGKVYKSNALDAPRYVVLECIDDMSNAQDWRTVAIYAKLTADGIDTKKRARPLQEFLSHFTEDPMIVLEPSHYT